MAKIFSIGIEGRASNGSGRIDSYSLIQYAAVTSANRRGTAKPSAGGMLDPQHAVGMRMLDGAVIHFGNPDRLYCLILYGEAWRGAASAALMELGLKNPHLVQPEGAAP